MKVQTCNEHNFVLRIHKINLYNSGLISVFSHFILVFTGQFCAMAVLHLKAILYSGLFKEILLNTNTLIGYRKSKTPWKQRVLWGWKKIWVKKEILERFRRKLYYGTQILVLRALQTLCYLLTFCLGLLLVLSELLKALFSSYQHLVLQTLKLLKNL